MKLTAIENDQRALHRWARQFCPDCNLFGLIGSWLLQVDRHQQRAVSASLKLCGSEYFAQVVRKHALRMEFTRMCITAGMRRLRNFGLEGNSTKFPRQVPLAQH